MEKLQNVLPSKAKVAVIDCIKKSMPEVPVEAVTLAFYSKVAEVMSIDKVRVTSQVHIKDGWHGVFPNLYGLIFMGSGIGKDRMISMMNKNFLLKIKSDYNTRYTTRMERYMENVQNEADEKYPGSKRLQADYKRSKELHAPILETSRGTPQAILSYRNSLSEVGIGGLYFHHSEFADYFMSRDENNKLFLDIVKEAYEGDTGAVILKSEKTAKATYNVPMNMLVHTSNYGFASDGATRDKLYSFFNRGYARRAFICVAQRDDNAIVYDTIEEEMQANKEVEETVKEVAADFWELYEANVGGKGYTYKLSDESDRLLFAYKKKIRMRREENPFAQEHVLTELESRHWKALKLACLISAYEEPDNREIGVDYMKAAIQLVEHYGGNFLKFFEEAQKEDHEKLFDYFYKKLGRFVKTTDIKKAGFVGKNRFSYWFNENIDLLHQYLAGGEYAIESKDLQPTGKAYRMYKREAEIQGMINNIEELEKDVAKQYT